jgi:hypothetical protein
MNAADDRQVQHQIELKMKGQQGEPPGQGGPTAATFWVAGAKGHIWQYSAPVVSPLIAHLFPWWCSQTASSSAVGVERELLLAAADMLTFVIVSEGTVFGPRRRFRFRV